MARFEIQPIHEESLAEVADFFAGWRNREQLVSAKRPNHEANSSRIESASYLRWLLVENPARDVSADLGYCIRNQEGSVVGAILTFPSYFVSAGQRLKGLCGASIFVNDEARIPGFIIFKKFVDTPGHDFFFSTTCNRDSGALWGKFRGRGHAVPNSECSYVLPYRPDSLLSAFAESRNFHPALAGVMRGLGSVAGTLVRAALKSASGLKVAPCRDWEKLSELAKLHRNHEWITNERSPAFLQWRYGQALAGDRKELYSFSDNFGNEGWFAIGSGVVGIRSQLRISELLDFVWPLKQFDPHKTLSAVVAQTLPASDALYVRSRASVPLNGFSRLNLRWKDPSPKCYVMASNGHNNLQPARFDFVAADGDSWP